MIQKFFIFLILNFGALGLGAIFTGKGVPSEWYTNLNKAPWTPPGWVFGFAWTTIMICFSIYLSQVWPEAKNKKLLIILFSLQWFLNVLWNPVFFQFNNIILGLTIISCLTLLILFFTIYYWDKIGLYSILILPYLIWLLIATSLNGYIYIKN